MEVPNALGYGCPPGFLCLLLGWRGSVLLPAMSSCCSWLPELGEQAAAEARYSSGAQLERGVCSYVENPTPLNLGGVQCVLSVPGFL